MQNLENTFNYMTSDQPMMSSREIADLTGKQHFHVLRDIRKIVNEIKDEPNMDDFDFKEVFDNREYTKEILLNKSLTLLLISGYNITMRARIIKRWQELEAQQSKFKVPQTFAEALRLAAEQQEKIEQLENKITQDAPKVEFHDLVRSENPRLSMNEFAKMLSKEHSVKIGQNKMMEYLRNAGYLMTGRDNTEKNKPYQKYMQMGWFEIEYKKTPVGLKVQTFITHQGQLELSEQIVNWFKQQ